jgi:hypothetical protein
MPHTEATKRNARGRIKTGSFVLQRTAIFDSDQAKESYFVIAGSAIGELHGLLGDGTSAVGHGMEHPFHLELRAR